MTFSFPSGTGGDPGDADIPLDKNVLFYYYSVHVCAASRGDRSALSSPFHTFGLTIQFHPLF
jgi:hypothetical protein